MVSKNVIREKTEVGIKAAFSKDTIRGKAEMESLREYGAYQRKNRSGNLTNSE